MQLIIIRSILTDFIAHTVFLLNLGQSLAGALSSVELILNSAPL